MNAKSKNLSERRTIRLNPKVAKSIDELAEKDNRSFSNMLETMLIRQLEQHGRFV
ncbi:ribbon-helix-helix protein, CopG family [Robiginitalea biformata]|uniref:ribbon-helix-helix protein, CopG family n=1 Tax=Robiginitalea biformata TaxID=252307 RepID=UPI000324E012